MKKFLKTLFITLSAITIALACFALFGCDDNPEGGNGGGNNGGGNTNNGETFVEYTLDSLVYSVSGQGDYYIDVNDMSSSDHATYDAVIAMYGKKVKISEKSIQFVDGTVLSASGKTGYTLSGENVRLSDSALSETFNYVKLSNGVFSLGIQQTTMGMTVTYAFEYYSPTAVPPSYRVTFDSNGGSAVESQTAKKGGKITKPADPKKTGYKFGGWYSDEKCTSAWNFSGGKVFSNVTLYAKWTANQNTVTFQTNGGSSVSSQSVATGNKITKPSDPQKAGYKFAGWYSDAGLKNAWNFSTAVTGNVTLYAKYTPASYNLSIDARGGTCSISTKTVNYDAKVGTLPVPTRNGFEFDGWYDSADGGNLYTADTVFTSIETTALYAKWNTKITLDTDGLGSVSKTECNAVYGWKQSSVDSLPDASVEGAAFAGWYTQPCGQGTKFGNNDNYSFDGAVTLYAAWQLDVSYDSAGGSAVNNSTVIRGGTFTPKTTSRTGYTFAGWFDGDGNEVTETTVINKDSAFTLTARWTANSITFNFDAQGGTCSQSETYTFDSPLGEMPLPVKEDNVFGGWFTGIAGADKQYTAESICDTASQITLYAKWTADVILEYEGATSGNSVEKLNFTYNAVINITLPEPYKTGWSFEGWFSEQNGGGTRLTDSSFGSSSVWNLNGDTHIYAYWVKGTDKRYLKYSGTNSITVTGLADKSVTELEIPAIINLKPVTSVSQSAFANTALTSASVPDSVTSIGNGAFKNCKLTEITLPFVGGNTTSTTQRERVFGYIFGYFNTYDSVENAIKQYEISSTSYQDWFYVPTTLEKVTVTGSYALPQYAFRNCSMLKEINLAGNVRTINSNAFSGCTGLTTITGLGSVTQVNASVFYNCTALTTFPESPLTTVGASAFYNCKNLTEVTFGDGLSSIGSHAFNMTGLTEIDLPAGLKSIGDYAFRNTGLTSVVVPDSVTSIGNGVFLNCKLTEITVPFVGQSITETYQARTVLGYIFGYVSMTSTVQNAIKHYDLSGSYQDWFYVPTTLEKVTVTGSYAIPQYAFSNCTMLKEINLAGNVSTINASAFSDCTGLTTVTGLGSVTQVNDYAFYNCTALTTFPESPLTTVGASAFYNCKNLTEVTFGDGLSSIGSHAFNQTGLTEIDLPEGLKSIGNYAFRSTKLTSVVVPDSVTNIGIAVFMNCKLTEITVPFTGATPTASDSSGVFGYIFGYEKTNGSSDTVENAVMQIWVQYYGYYWYYIPKTLEKITVTGSYAIPEYAFNNCTMLKEINFTGNVGTINASAFSDCTGLTTVTGLGSVTQVNDYAFYNCTALTTFPESPLIKVGTSAFYNCKNLTEITFGDGLSSIGASAFGLTGLTEISLPEGLKTIGNYAFRSTKLTSVVVPDSVTSIGNGAFQNCKLTEITVPFTGATPTASDSSGVFGYIFGYKKTNGSSDTVENAVMQIYLSNDGFYWYYVPQTLEKVTVTGSYNLHGYAFRNCTMLKEINLMGTVTEISSYAFAGCGSLLVINGLENVTKVNEYAFYGCVVLTTFPESALIKVGEDAFYNCKNLTEVTFGDGLSSIGSHAFNMTGLTEISLPEGLKSIGNYAFRSTKLTSVVVPDSVTNIGIAVFMNCKLTEITVPFTGATLTASDSSGVFGYIFGYKKTNGSSDTVENAVMQIYLSNDGFYWYYVPQTLEKVTVTGNAIPTNAFNNCTMLKEINFTGNVSTINAYAFSGCTGLTTLTFASEPPTTVSSSFGLSKKVTLIVPDEYVEAYQTKFNGYTVVGKSEEN